MSSRFNPNFEVGFNGGFSALENYPSPEDIILKTADGVAAKDRKEHIEKDLEHDRI